MSQSTEPPSSAPSAYRREARLVILAFSVVAMVQVVAFRIEGRRWWCKCGERFLLSLDINSMHNSQHVIDPYSISHVLHGLVFYFALKLIVPKMRFASRLAIALFVELFWEVLENSPVIIERYRSATVSLGYEGDTVANGLSDLLMSVIGYLIAWRLGWKGSLALFVVAELVMLAWIRDNLTLNVLMLLYPVPSIRQWQAG